MSSADFTDDSDLIDLSAYDVSDISDFDVAQVGDATVITDYGIADASITLNDFNVNDLINADFIFG